MSAPDGKIHLEQIRLIYNQGPVLVIGSTLCGLMVAAFVARELPSGTLSLWVSGLLGTCLLRLLIIRAYQRADEATRRAPLWGPFFWLGTLSAGALWGAWPLGFYDAQSVEFLMLISTIFAGMVAVSAASGGVYLPSFVSFSMPLAIPLSLAHLASGNDSLRFVGGLLLMFLAVNLFLALRGNRQYRALLAAQFRNQELMERLAQEKLIAERAVIAKSRFLAAASHDLRQPLHALGLLIGVLAGRERDPKQREIVDDMACSADALNGLFNSLLDVSRLDAEIIEVRPAHLSLAELFDRLRVRFVRQANEKGLALAVDAPACTVYADPILLERVLGNLVANAVQYTERGRIELVAEPLSDGRCAIELRDTGIGIPDEAREEVFAEYCQLGNPEGDRGKGLGLGLAIVRRLSVLMRMPLEMVSTPGVGTRFTLTLPTGDPLAVHAAAVAPQAAPEVRGRCVLVIDDEPQVLKGMRHALESLGCDVMTAASTREALGRIALREGSPELILSDYRLRDGESGLDAIAALREALERELPAVVITGDTSPERLREVTASGLEVLHKPVSRADLAALLERLLPVREEAQEVARTSRPMVRPCSRIDSTTIT